MVTTGIPRSRDLAVDYILEPQLAHLSLTTGAEKVSDFSLRHLGIPDADSRTRRYELLLIRQGA